MRWCWRQLASMRTALLLLLLLAVAAVPGSLVPQTSADPNGVAQWKLDHPELYPILNSLQVFDTYTSVWFSAIYLLLFISLIGCVLPRVVHHLRAMRNDPPHTPARLQRMVGFTVRVVPAEFAPTPEEAVEGARRILKSSGYRAVIMPSGPAQSVSAERGYLRETGNLVFHAALLGILVAVAVGGGLGFTGQRIVMEGQTFVNSYVNYDSFSPGRFLNQDSLAPYSITLDKLDVKYESQNKNAMGEPLDFTAHVTAKQPGHASDDTQIKVNAPLEIGGTSVYLLGNGYAPEITVRNPNGDIVFQDPVPFLPQDQNMTSQGVVKVPDGLKQQIGMIGLFYPTTTKLPSGALASTYPSLRSPTLALNVYAGNLGLDNGVPVSVYALDISKLTQIAGPGSKTAGLELTPGQTVDLPNGLGTITFNGVKRYASLDVHHDPAQGWMVLFTLLAVAGLLTSLLMPRRRLWVKAQALRDGSLRLEYAGLARGDDPTLPGAVSSLAEKHSGALIPPDDVS